MVRYGLPRAIVKWVQVYLFRSLHHHVHVKEACWDFSSQTFDHGMTKGEIGHKMTIHNIQMEIVRPRVQQSVGLR